MPTGFKFQYFCKRNFLKKIGPKKESKFDFNFIDGRKIFQFDSIRATFALIILNAFKGHTTENKETFFKLTDFCVYKLGARSTEGQKYLHNQIGSKVTMETKG